MARALLLISALAALSCPALGYSCSSSSYGDISGFPIVLNTVKVPPGPTVKYDTTAVATCAATGRQAKGVHVAVCSDSGNVFVKVENLHHALITATAASEAKFTVYCSNIYTRSGGEESRMPTPVAFSAGLAGDRADNSYGDQEYYQ